MENLVQKNTSIQFESNEYYISPICDFVRSIMRDFLEEHRIFAFNMILAQTIQNRIKTGFPDKNGAMSLDIRVDSYEISIVLTDKGNPMDSDFTFHENDIFKSQKDFNNMLLHTFLDSVEVNRLGRDGQSICMKLNILDRSQSTYIASKTSAIPQDNNIQICTLESKEDAIDVIKCLYDAYGYSYCYEKMYYEDSLIELNNSNKIKTFILKNDHNQTAGTFSLFFTAEYLNMPEIGTVIVCKEFRKLHLAKDLIARGIEEARKAGSSAVMARPVDFHTATQKVCNGYGMTPTAFIFEYVDTEMSAEYSNEKTRFDVCCCVKLFDREEKRILYPPKRIINFTESIYKKLGANYEISSDDEIEDFTLSSVDTNHRLMTTRIVVTQTGKNFEQFLSGCVNSAILNKHEMIELSLNMFFSGCDYAFEIARKKGFTFSGIIPGSMLGDYIIMQMLPGKDVDYNRPVLTDGYIELLEEIKRINADTESTGSISLFDDLSQ